MPDVDIRPAAAQLAGLLALVPDDALDAPTPCEDMTLGQLIGHVIGFAEVFTLTARKDLGPMTATPPRPGDADLAPGWQQRAAEHLGALGAAWQADDAWDGMTQAGGVDLPGAAAGRVVLDELIVHGWDVARATGQPFDPDEGHLAEVEAMVGQLRGANTGEIPGLFGPVVTVPAHATPLERVLGLTGRDPAWTP
jgi:uncharacterized protein (TIGR03086 family)